MPTATFLIGLPASGKSTFRDVSDPYCTVASSDDYIEAYALKNDMTYNEAFAAAIDDAQEHFERIVNQAVEDGRDIVIDRTNLSVKSRSHVLKKIPEEWTKRAIVFKHIDYETWMQRLKGRAGKTIPNNVLISMMQSYQHPTKDEGFDEVMVYYT